LAALGHFNPENIVPNPIPNPEDGTVDIEYQLEEKANDQLEVSGGWGAGMFVGTIGLRFSNFSTRRMLDPKAWRPVPTGDGQTLSLRAQSNGRYYQSYNMTFVEPWFGGKKPNSFSFSLFHQKINETRGSYYFQNLRELNKSKEYMKISGGSIGLGRRLKWPDDFFTLYNELSYQRYRLNDYFDYFQVGENQFLDDGAFNLLSFNTTLSRNSQDQPIYPRRGSNFSVGVQLTPPWSLFKEDRFWEISESEAEIIRGDLLSRKPSASIAEQNEAVSDAELAEKFRLVEHHKWTVKGSWFQRIFDDLVIMTKSEFGFKGYYNRDIGSSPFEGYQVGGDGPGYGRFGVETIGLRGYENYSLTQHQVSQPGSTVGRTQRRYANIYNKYTIELRYPFTLSPSASIYGLLFVEVGNVWYDLNTFNPFIVKRSAGFGIRAFLPMFGMLGIDWGYGFDDIPYNPGKNGGQFHFVLGQQF
ncbi:MAG: BamA/OMP85 family outer membrane protein, partial [Bacteroidota bacterium]